MLPSIVYIERVVELYWFVTMNMLLYCNRHEDVYFVVSIMMWARYLNNNYCDYNLILAFILYTYFLEYNVIVI